MSKNNQQSALKATIDKMVEDSIRRILPEVMNEVLLRTLAQGNVIQEQRRPQQQRRPAQPAQTQQVKRQQKLAGIDRSMSLREALSADDAGADYYEQAERAINSRRAPITRPQPIVEQQYNEDEMYGDDEVFDFNDDPPPAPRQNMREQVIAQKISQLPPALQGLAEETFRVVDEGDYEVEGEMWDDNGFGDDLQESSQAKAPPLNIDRAAQVAGVDWSRSRQLLGLTEQKAPQRPDPNDFHNEVQWKMQQLERKRRELDSKKIG